MCLKTFRRKCSLLTQTVLAQAELLCADWARSDDDVKPCGALPEEVPHIKNRNWYVEESSLGMRLITRARTCAYAIVTGSRS